MVQPSEKQKLIAPTVTVVVCTAYLSHIRPAAPPHVAFAEYFGDGSFGSQVVIGGVANEIVPNIRAGLVHHCCPTRTVGGVLAPAAIVPYRDGGNIDAVFRIKLHTTRLTLALSPSPSPFRWRPT
jgi:hypothetical protein